MKSILIATKNKGKLHEYEHLLLPYGYQIKSLFDFPEMDDIEETEDTFEGNALLKAKELHLLTKMPVIADDSGLMVEALKGEPGVHSKRYSKAGTDEANNQLLLTNIRHEANKSAKFVAVIAYYVNENEYYVFRGETEGQIILSPRGNNGFGYDPLFYYPEKQKTFAELSKEEKNIVSHRAKAFQKFIAFLEGNHEVSRL